MELASTTWESASWDPDRDMLVFDWGDIKTGRQCEMTLHPHHDGWEMDPIHALACYLICGTSAYKATASAAATCMIYALFGSVRQYVWRGGGSCAPPLGTDCTATRDQLRGAVSTC